MKLIQTFASGAQLLWGRLMGSQIKGLFNKNRHCGERSDVAIQSFAVFWIAMASYEASR